MCQFCGDKNHIKKDIGNTTVKTPDSVGFFYIQNILSLEEYKLELKLLNIFDVIGNTVIDKLPRLQEAYMTKAADPSKLDEKRLRELIEIISVIDYNLFVDVLDESVFNSIDLGGRSVLASWNINIDFKLLNKNTEKYFKKNNLTLSKQVSKKIQKLIKNEILAGVKNSEGVDEIKRRILKLWDKPIRIKVPAKYDELGNIIKKGYSYEMSAKQWATIVSRSELIKGYNQGRLEAYAQSGVVQAVQFSASADEITCAVCWGMDGMIFTLEAAFGVIPVHAQCRCLFVAYFATKVDVGDIRETAENNIKTLYQSVGT
jgi:SPP1 gp7 family putative phage head morphogenesis protein